MKTSAFGGHIIYQEDSDLLITENNMIFESYDNSRKFEIESKLKSFGICEFEQFYCISLSPARDLLRKALSINEIEYNNLFEYAKKVIGENSISNLNQSIVFNKGLGAIHPGFKLITESKGIPRVKQVTNGVNPDFIYILVRAKFVIESNLNVLKNFPNSICPFHDFISIKNQGSRGTCVAFAVTSSHEYSHLKASFKNFDFSEQYLYYEAKQIDGNDECGTTIASAIQVIATKGQCREQFWPYKPTVGCNEHGTKPFLADSDSTNYKAPCLELNPNDIEIFKASILSGCMISFSIPVYESWYTSNEVNRTGRITMPISKESILGGHAMSIIGYEDDDSYPGGGFFLFRNSWGKQWANHNPFGQGYGIIPYEYIKQYCWEAFTSLFA